MGERVLLVDEACVFGGFYWNFDGKIGVWEQEKWSKVVFLMVGSGVLVI
jgi:hypothetical protein